MKPFFLLFHRGLTGVQYFLSELQFGMLVYPVYPVYPVNPVEVVISVDISTHATTLQAPFSARTLRGSGFPYWRYLVFDMPHFIMH